jgi:DNA-binding XRE family transcriptional regulator
MSRVLVTRRLTSIHHGIPSHRLWQVGYHGFFGKVAFTSRYAKWYTQVPGRWSGALMGVLGVRFNERLRELREKAGLTQRALAERAGVPLGSIQHHEQGVRVPSWASVAKICRALGVSCEAFMDCDEVADAPKVRQRKRK